MITFADVVCPRQKLQIIFTMKATNFITYQWDNMIYFEARYSCFMINLFYFFKICPFWYCIFLCGPRFAVFAEVCTLRNIV